VRRRGGRAWRAAVSTQGMSRRLEAVRGGPQTASGRVLERGDAAADDAAPPVRIARSSAVRVEGGPRSVPAVAPAPSTAWRSVGSAPPPPRSVTNPPSTRRPRVRKLPGPDRRPPPNNDRCRRSPGWAGGPARRENPAPIAPSKALRARRRLGLHSVAAFAHRRALHRQRLGERPRCKERDRLTRPWGPSRRDRSGPPPLRPSPGGGPSGRFP